MTDIIYMSVGKHMKVLGVSTTDLAAFLERLNSLEELLERCQNVLDDEMCIPNQGWKSPSTTGLCTWDSWVSLVQQLKRQS